jgi:phosphate/sulfate permease
MQLHDECESEGSNDIANAYSLLATIVDEVRNNIKTTGLRFD